MFAAGALFEYFHRGDRYDVQDLALVFVVGMLATIMILLVEKDKLGGRGHAAREEYARRRRR